MSRELRKETANKGFSLVELIIVVAIMAVLIGILAPQYIKYVEKSKTSADHTTTDELVKAMQVLASDPDVTLSNATGIDYSFSTVANASAITVSTDLSTLLTNEGLIATMPTTYQSTTYNAAAFSYKLQFNTTKNVWEVVVATGAVPAR